MKKLHRTAFVGFTNAERYLIWSYLIIQNLWEIKFENKETLNTLDDISYDKDRLYQIYLELKKILPESSFSEEDFFTFKSSNELEFKDICMAEFKTLAEKRVYNQ